MTLIIDSLEYLTVQCVGSDRVSALADADRQARQWFGEYHCRRLSVHMTAAYRTVTGTVTAWAGTADYRIE
jgi:hypothetical protein